MRTVLPLVVAGTTSGALPHATNYVSLYVLPPCDLDCNIEEEPCCSPISGPPSVSGNHYSDIELLKIAVTSYHDIFSLHHVIFHFNVQKHQSNSYGYSHQMGYQTSDFRLLWTITPNPPSPPPHVAPPPPLEGRPLLPDMFTFPPPISHFFYEKWETGKLMTKKTPLSQYHTSPTVTDQILGN